MEQPKSMKTITTSVLGFDIPITDVPETLDEAVTSAGGEQKLVDTFVNHIKFHKTNGVAREAVAEALEKLTGVKPTTEQKKSPTKADPNRVIEVQTETEQEYANRVFAESGRSAEDLQSEVAAAVGSIKFDAVTTREPGAGRKMAKVYTESAEKLIALGADTYNRSLGLLEKSNPGLTIERDEQGTPKVESLAAALKRNKERVEAEANAALGLPSAA